MSTNEKAGTAAARVLGVPEMGLVVLVGVSGAGKSTFAAKHFASTQVISSDHCRGLVSDDENDQSASADAFSLLHTVVDIRLRRGLLAVVDATNVQAGARQDLLRVAKANDVLSTAIVLDVPEALARERNRDRPDRDFGDHVIRRQRRDLRQSVKRLRREGFRKVYVLSGPEEIDAATVELERAWPDRKELTGPFDVVGDVHGCREELEELLGDLGYAFSRDGLGRPVGARHPEGRTAVFVGDLVDRGPDSPGVLRLVMGMVADGDALCVPGNHENKLIRVLRGGRARLTHGLAETMEQLGRESEEFRERVLDFCDGLVSHLILDGGRLVVAHAGLKEAYHGRASGRVRSFALYGDTTGETDEYGLPCGCRGRASTGAGPPWSTGTRRWSGPSGSTTPSAWTPAACSAAGSPRCATPSASWSTWPPTAPGTSPRDRWAANRRGRRRPARTPSWTSPTSVQATSAPACSWRPSTAGYAPAAAAPWPRWRS